MQVAVDRNAASGDRSAATPPGTAARQRACRPGDTLTCGSRRTGTPERRISSGVRNPAPTNIFHAVFTNLGIIRPHFKWIETAATAIRFQSLALGKLRWFRLFCLQDIEGKGFSVSAGGKCSTGRVLKS
jgi:hypothetical protein